MNLKDIGLKKLKNYLKEINLKIESAKIKNDTKAINDLESEKLSIVEHIKILDDRMSSIEVKGLKDKDITDSEIKNIAYKEILLRSFIKQANSRAYFIGEISKIKNYFFDITILEKGKTCSFNIVSNHFIEEPYFISKESIKQIEEKGWNLNKGANGTNLFKKIFPIETELEIRDLNSTIYWLVSEIFRINDSSKIQVRYDVG